MEKNTEAEELAPSKKIQGAVKGGSTVSPTCEGKGQKEQRKMFGLSDL